MNMVCWICPECGRENDVTLEDCPGCAPVAVAEEPAPVADAAEPTTAAEPAPIADEPAPTTEEPTEAAEGVEPVAEEPAPIAEPAESTIVAESAPVPEEFAPIPDSAEPISDASPIAEEPAPIDEPTEAESVCEPPRLASRAPLPLPGRLEWSDSAATRDAHAFLSGVAVLDCAPEPSHVPEPSLTLAARVQDPAPRPPFVSIDAIPAMPQPWRRTVLDALALPAPPLDPDHTAAHVFQNDLVRLLDALRQSPGLPLLGAGNGEAKALARPQDLEYFPEPKSLAPRAPWQVTVNPTGAPHEMPRQSGRAETWPERAGALPELSTDAPAAAFAPPCKERQPWHPEVPPRAAAIRPVACPPHARLSDRGVILPFFLRRFQENSILVSPRVITRNSTPGWLVTVLTAVILLVTAATFLPKSTFAQHSGSRGDAPGAEAALGAFPSFSRYVEVTGIRAATDTGNAEIRYVLVNHSPTDLPAFSINVSVVPARGGAPVFSFSSTVQGMVPNESRELRTAISQTLPAAQMPDWQDLRADVRITARE